MDLNEKIKLAQDGNSEAFAKIYDEFADKIFRYIKIKVQNLHHAEDILQDTFVKAWKGLPKFNNNTGHFSAWLYKIATNTINSYYRKLYSRPEALELSEEIEIYEPSKSLLEKSIDTSDIENVKIALTKINPTYSRILELRFVQDFTISETAEILNKSNLGIRIAQHRALKQLKEVLKTSYDNEYSTI